MYNWAGYASVSFKDSGGVLRLRSITNENFWGSLSLPLWVNKNKHMCMCVCAYIYIYLRMLVPSVSAVFRFTFRRFKVLSFRHCARAFPFPAFRFVVSAHRAVSRTPFFVSRAALRWWRSSSWPATPWQDIISIIVILSNNYIYIHTYIYTHIYIYDIYIYIYIFIHIRSSSPPATPWQERRIRPAVRNFQTIFCITYIISLSLYIYM